MINSQKKDLKNYSDAYFVSSQDKCVYYINDKSVLSDTNVNYDDFINKISIIGLNNKKQQSPNHTFQNQKQD